MTGIWGILNITPDSFSDGGRYLDRDTALAHARALRAQGATVIDVGGESTRPGATRVSVAEEQARVLPISDKSNDYAARVLGALAERGLRATMDDSNDRVQAKIKVAADLKIPYLLVVGPRDEENGTVSIRARGIQKDLGALALPEAAAALAAERDTRGETSLAARFA